MNFTAEDRQIRPAGIMISENASLVFDVTSRLRLLSTDPTRSIRGQLVALEPLLPVGDALLVEKPVLLCELVARRFEPYRVEEEISFSDREGGDEDEDDPIRVEHDDHDQATVELYDCIYTSGAQHREELPQNNQPHGSALVITDITCFWSGSSSWIIPLAIQSLLDAEEDAVHVVLVDLDVIEPTAHLALTKALAPFRFTRISVDGYSFLVRDPAMKRRRVSSCAPDDALVPEEEALKRVDSPQLLS